MDSSIIVALISVAGGIIVQLIIAMQNRKARVTEDAVYKAQLQKDMDAIKTKLDIHNGYAEKIGGVQQDIALIKQDIEHIKEGMGKKG